MLIPARDEESSLPALLASLAVQTRPPDQVIVVDDASTDATAAVARRAGATVVDSAGPPAGWSGKCWALHQGQAVATGGLLVFLDADVTVAPGGLARLMAAHDRQGAAGIVSVAPRHRPGGAVEGLSAVGNVVALMGTGAFTRRPGRRRGVPTRPMAFGPCLAVDRATYDAAGGHGAPDVRARICEDLYLARAVAGTGAPVTLATGGDAVAMRMYPGGARQAFDGWTKVLATGAAGGSPVVVAAVAAWVTGALLASASGLRGVGALLRRRRPAGADTAPLRGLGGPDVVAAAHRRRLPPDRGGRLPGAAGILRGRLGAIGGQGRTRPPTGMEGPGHHRQVSPVAGLVGPRGYSGRRATRAASRRAGSWRAPPQGGGWPG